MAPCWGHQSLTAGGDCVWEKRENTRRRFKPAKNSKKIQISKYYDVARVVLPFLLTLRGSHNRTFQRVSLVISDSLTRRKPVELEFSVASVPEPQ